MNKFIYHLYVPIFILIGYIYCSDKPDDLHTGPTGYDDDNYQVTEITEENLHEEEPTQQPTTTTEQSTEQTTQTTEQTTEDTQTNKSTEPPQPQPYQPYYSPTQPYYPGPQGPQQYYGPQYQPQPVPTAQPIIPVQQYPGPQPTHRGPHPQPQPLAITIPPPSVPQQVEPEPSQAYGPYQPQYQQYYQPTQPQYEPYQHYQQPYLPPQPQQPQQYYQSTYQQYYTPPQQAQAQYQHYPGPYQPAQPYYPGYQQYQQHPYEEYYPGYQPQPVTTIEESKEEQFKKFEKCKSITFFKNEEGNFVPMSNEDYIESFPNKKITKYLFKSNLEKLYCNDKIIYTHKSGRAYCTSLTYNNKTNYFIMNTGSEFYLIKYYKGKWEMIERKIHKHIELYGKDDRGMRIKIDENFYYTDFIRPNSFKHVFLPDVMVIKINVGTKTIWKKSKMDQFPVGLSFTSFSSLVLHFKEYSRIFRMIDGEYCLFYTKNN